MTADEYLGRIAALESRIHGKLAEIQKLAALTSIVTDGESPKAAIHELDALADELIAAQAEIVATLEKLPAQEYEVLHRHYVRGQTYEFISEDLKPRPCSVRHVYRIRDKGLELVQKMLGI